MLNSLLTWIFKTRSFVKPKSSTQGFTLMELMVAASMTLVVVGMAGWALLTIVKSNKIAKATSEMQYDFNRAVEFMVEEIKGGKKIYHGTDLESDLAGISGTFNTYYQSRKSWITPVLAFQPDASVGEYVVYYIVDTDNSGSTGENWQVATFCIVGGPIMEQMENTKQVIMIVTLALPILFSLRVVGVVQP